MSDQSLQILETIRTRLDRTARRKYLTHLVFGSVLLLGVIAGLWLFFTTIEAGFWLNSTARWTVLLVTALSAAIVVVGFIAIPLLKILQWLPGTNKDALAREVGASFPQISDRLLNLLNLAEGKSTSSSSPFIDHAVMSLNRQIEPVEFEKMDGFDRSRRAMRYALVPFAGILVFLLAAPGSFFGASQRILAPGTEFFRPAPFKMNITPGSANLLRGDSLTVRISLEGSELPTALNLLHKNEGEEKVVSEGMSADSNGVFSFTFYNVRRSFTYRITSQAVSSPWYDVNIVERPLIRTLQVALEFPRYSRIPPQRLAPNVGDIQALPGTRVAIESTIGGPSLHEAFVQYDDGSVDSLTIDGNLATGSFVLSREGSYTIMARDQKGVENIDPIKYAMRLLDDAYPAVELLSPAPISELGKTLDVPLLARITDDFGFTRLRLHYRLSESRFGATMPTFESIEIPLDNRYELDQETSFRWLLNQMTELDPVPGDAIEYYLQVWDNDSVSRFKSTKSATHLLRLPSLAEQYSELDQKQDDVQEEMEDLLRNTTDIKDQFNELRDELQNKPENDWEDQRQLEQIKEKQEELESRVESLNQSFEDMSQQMEDNNLVSDETQQLYEEMQQVLEEINSPELMDALKDLQEAMQDLNLQQMQESMNSFQFNEDQYQQRLERTLELFKKLRIQQDMEEIAQRAEALAEQQEQLQEETEALKQEQMQEDGAPEAEGEQQEGEQQEGPQQEASQQEEASENANESDQENQEGEQQANNESQESEAQENMEQQGENESQENDAQENGSENQQSPSRQEELAKQQELSKEEMEAIEKKLEEILSRMEEAENMPLDEMQQMNEQIQQQDIPENMQENADELRNNELNDAQQGQQQMQQQLQQMQQQMQQMQQGMQGQQMQVNMAGLRRALSDILTLSQLQEGLREDLRDLAPDSPTIRQVAQDQVEMSASLRVVSDSLQQLSKDIPQMTREVQQHAGDAMREMGSAVEAMTDRVANRASGHQKESMMHLNELALLLSDLLNEMMNSQGSGGGNMSMQQMIQQLQDAAQQQQQLNQQIQQMLNESQGNRLTQDMQNRLRQLSAQQEQIRSQIKQLSRNRELRRQVMGDLNRIAEQMEETIRELQDSRQNRKTVERQQEILTRLLEATKSLQERGREKRREGTLSEDLYRDSPSDLSPSEESDKLRRALIEALESGYSPDYEELIKRYFELLQERSLEEN